MFCEMRKLKIYTATTIDGYIAGPKDEIDWLNDAGTPDYDYKKNYDSIDTTIMGNSTYKVTLTAPKFPYQDKNNYVFTKNKLLRDTSYVKFISDDIGAFVRSLKQKSGKDIWLVGGGQINTIMLNHGLIDEMILIIFPLILGEGIPLFAPSAPLSKFKIISCKTYDTGLIQWRLERR